MQEKGMVTNKEIPFPSSKGTQELDDLGLDYQRVWMDIAALLQLVIFRAPDKGHHSCIHRMTGLKGMITFKQVSVIREVLLRRT